MPQNLSVKKGQDIELDIRSLAFGGLGVSKFNDIVTFVKNAIPGQKVNARVVKKRSSYLEARVVEVLVESPFYNDAKCGHFDDCGGCTFQNLKYKKQILEKEIQVKDLFDRIGGLSNIKIEKIIECDEVFHYRNKMEFTFSNFEYIPENEKNRKGKDFVLGLHAPGRWDKILDIDNCFIQDPLANQILSVIKLVTNKMEPYNIREHTGFLRNVIIRMAKNTSDIMVNIVTSFDHRKSLVPVVDALISKFPSITSIINNITSRKAGISMGEKQILLYGNEYIIDKLGQYKFMISADSFFQTNTIQAEKLYDIILEESNLTGNEIVYDLFCGTGSISLYVAKFAKMVYGFEVVPSAIEDAMQNAILNNVKNSWFFLGNLESLLRENPEVKTLDLPDVVIIDPPRAGIHNNTIKDILNKMPKRIVYVSCNPSTQARDVSIFCKNNYIIKKIRPLDMFPHTPHIENIVTLIKE